MKLKELLRDVEIAGLHADEDMEIGDVCYDSRKAAPGAAFVAVRLSFTSTEGVSASGASSQITRLAPFSTAAGIYLCPSVS